MIEARQDETRDRQRTLQYFISRPKRGSTQHQQCASPTWMRRGRDRDRSKPKQLDAVGTKKQSSRTTQCGCREVANNTTHIRLLVALLPCVPYRNGGLEGGLDILAGDASFADDGLSTTFNPVDRGRLLVRAHVTRDGHQLHFGEHLRQRQRQRRRRQRQQQGEGSGEGRRCQRRRM